MRRLYSTFAHGPAGIGLLIIRVVLGLVLLTHAVTTLQDSPHTGLALFAIFSGIVGVLMIIGLWTPVAGTLAALASFGCALWMCADRWYSLRIGMLSLALALLGPGSWSVDARLFGWRRLEIRDPKKPDSPAE